MFVLKAGYNIESFAENESSYSVVQKQAEIQEQTWYSNLIVSKILSTSSPYPSVSFPLLPAPLLTF